MAGNIPAQEVAPLSARTSGWPSFKQKIVRPTFDPFSFAVIVYPANARRMYETCMWPLIFTFKLSEISPGSKVIRLGTVMLGE